MRKALLVLLIASCTITAHAAKTTIDPNKTTSAQPQAVAEVDTRLQQKVTYISGNVRLHTVTESLTKKTGVAIYAGSNSKDWHVRDVPVCVNVKDMPLGDLLDTLAGCVHARLGSERMSDDPKALRSYRIYRRTNEVITLPPASKTADAQVEWAWDSLASLKSATPEVRAQMDRESLLLSEIVSSLGPDAKAKLLARETLFVDIKGSPQQAWLSELYDIGLSKANAYARENKRPLPNIPQDPDNGLLRIAVRGNGSGGYLALEADISPGSWRANLLNQAENLPYKTGPNGEVSAVKGLKLAPKPQSDPATSMLADLNPPTGWERMDKTCKADILDKEIDLAWESKTVEPTYADLVAAVAEKTGLNIVREDFSSHRRNESESARSQFVPKTTLRKALLGNFNPGWLLNKKTNTVIFWEFDWSNQHVDLVPENLVSSLREKLNSDGVEFGDVLPILSLTTGQFTEWIADDKELSVLKNIALTDVFWKFVGQLSPEEQASAMSENGLHIGTLDMPWVADYFTKTEREMKRSFVPVSAHLDREHQEKGRRRIAPMTNEAIAKTAILRIKSEPAAVNQAGDESKLTWYIELDLTKSGESEPQRVCTMYPPFPIFSAARASEINKTNTKK